MRRTSEDKQLLQNKRMPTFALVIPSVHTRWIIHIGVTQTSGQK
jgi:hypothetical protein